MIPTTRRVLALLLLASLAFNGCGQSGQPAAPRGVVALRGSPQEIGAQHGRLLADQIKLVIKEYIEHDLVNGKLTDTALQRVNAMKPALPQWFRDELSACAVAAGVDEDVLLYTQCEGDIKSLGGCTSYVAFGPATHDGKMEIGRNFDYWGLDSTEQCATILAVVPRPEDGYAFVSVGWSGILGGWTFFNEKGLFVSNNLGGFREKNPAGVPTLILERILAQKAATLDEAIALIRQTPRMRGQALVIGESGAAPKAAVVLYDGAKVEVMPATDGFAFHTSVGTDRERLLGMLKSPTRQPTDVIKSAGSAITLHSVAIRPEEHAVWVAHGRPSAAHEGAYVKYDVEGLLRR
jgi:hypothetical protein